MKCFGLSMLSTSRWLPSSSRKISIGQDKLFYNFILPIWKKYSDTNNCFSQIYIWENELIGQDFLRKSWPAPANYWKAHFDGVVKNDRRSFILTLDNDGEICYFKQISFQWYHQYVLPHFFPNTYRCLAQTSISSDLPSGKVTATRLRRRSPRFIRSTWRTETLAMYISIRASSTELSRWR